MSRLQIVLCVIVSGDCSEVMFGYVKEGVLRVLPCWMLYMVWHLVE